MILSLDLDGTLLTSDKKVPESTKEYLQELKNKGIIIVLNTGRMLPRALAPIGDACFANYIIADTGATIYNVDTKQVVSELSISKEDCQKLFELSKDISNEFEIFTINEYYKYSKIDSDVEENGILINDYSDILDRDIKITHITIDCKEQGLVDKFVAENKDKFEDLKVFDMIDSFGTEKWVEIIVKEAGKYNALAKLARMLNVNTKNIIGFGDAINDLDVIENSGVGVAMINAIPKLKQNAKYVTDFSNDERGVERWLRQNLKSFSYHLEQVP